MSDEKKKEYLQGYRMSEQELMRLQEELALWESRAQKMTMSWSTAPGGGLGEGFPACVERILELREELQQEMERGVRLRRDTWAAIGAIVEPRQRLVLQFRYLDGLTWERIAEKMNITYQWACHLHKLALKNFVLVDSN